MLRETIEKPGLSSPEHSPDRLGHALRTRMQTTLDRLEREARRMLQLEAELSAFAHRYYEAVGTVSERLAQLEQQWEQATKDDTLALPAVLAQKDAREARRVELKTRYRNLAKEIHPDLVGVSEMNHMHTLNAAYQHGDLAGLLKLEALMTLTRLAQDATTPAHEVEGAVREVGRAADTYASGYRTMLHSPLNELMLRALQAKLAGWDWVETVVRKLERRVEEKERALAMHGIAQISAWREAASGLAA